MATFSSIALRAFACALRLSPHVASRPRRRGGGGGQEAGCSAQRWVGRGPGEARGAEIEPRRWLWGLGWGAGKRFSAFRGSECPSAPKKEGALNHSEGAIHALSGNIPASAFPR